MNVSVATSSADPKAAAARDMQHGWEETDAGQMWSGVREDADGNLISEGGGPRSAQDLVRLRRKRLSRADYARSSRRLARDMIRYVYVVLDVSGAAHERDGALAPSRTRLDAALSVLSLFASEYYDQNPLSHLGLVAVRDGEAEMVTRLTGSKAAHAAGLARVRSDANAALASNPNSAGGVFSLQNGLEVAGRSLGHMPRYGSREILVLMGSNATCDPGDVLLETLPRLKKSGVRVSTVALAAEIHVCRMIAEKTGGIMAVCLDRTHLRDLVMGQCVPPPVRPGGGRDGGSNGASGGSESGRTCEYVRMGFPSRRTEEVPTLIHAGGGGLPLQRSGGRRTSAPDARQRRPSSQPIVPCADSSWCWRLTWQGASTISSPYRPSRRSPRRLRSAWADGGRPSQTLPVAGMVVTPPSPTQSGASTSPRPFAPT